MSKILFSVQSWLSKITQNEDSFITASYNAVPFFGTNKLLISERSSSSSESNLSIPPPYPVRQFQSTDFAFRERFAGFVVGVVILASLFR